MRNVITTRQGSMKQLILKNSLRLIQSVNLIRFLSTGGSASINAFSSRYVTVLTLTSMPHIFSNMLHTSWQRSWDPAAGFRTTFRECKICCSQPQFMQKIFLLKKTPKNITTLCVSKTNEARGLELMRFLYLIQEK